MKFNKLYLIFTLSLSLGATGAFAETQPSEAHETLQERFESSRPTRLPFSWEQLRAFVQKCAVQPFARGTRGRKVLGTLRSVCPELSVYGAHARFTLHGETFKAEITESPFSDGGDLIDLKITNERGEVLAEAPTVLAYSDVILALALGNDDFAEIEDDTLLLKR